MPPRVSVIISCKPGQPCRLPLQAGPDMEILVATGRNVSQQRNQAARQACGELLYFLDDDSGLSATSLKLALTAMDQQPGWAAVGGPSVTRPGATGWERVFGAVLCSRAATLTTRPRNYAVGPPREVMGQELITCNLMVRRDWFEKVGGFDVTLYPGEDVEFVQRLRQAGGRLFYHPGMVVERSRRSTLSAFLWQYFRYGLARGALFVHLRPNAQWLFLLPFLLCIGLPLSVWVGLLYAGVCMAASLEVWWHERDLSLAGLALMVVPLMHLVYGLGVGLGLAYKLLGFSLNQPDPAVEVRQLRG